MSTSAVSKAAPPGAAAEDKNAKLRFGAPELSREQINQTLAHNQITQLVNIPGLPVRQVTYAQYAANEPIEDTHQHLFFRLTGQPKPDRRRLVGDASQSRGFWSWLFGGSASTPQPVLPANRSDDPSNDHQDSDYTERANHDPFGFGLGFDGQLESQIEDDDRMLRKNARARRQVLQQHRAAEGTNQQLQSREEPPLAVGDSAASRVVEANTSSHLLVGVFDGHTGRGTSTWLRDNLFPWLVSRWLRAAQSSADALRNGPVWSPSAFVEADNLFLDQMWAMEQPKEGLSGACFAVGHVSKGAVRVANGGDCRVVLGRRHRLAAQSAAEDVTAGGSGQTPLRPAFIACHPLNLNCQPHLLGLVNRRPQMRAGKRGLQPPPEIAPAITGDYEALTLTVDHAMRQNPAEKARLIAEHPDEDNVVHRNRIKGHLEPTRGMGDGAYKRMEYFMQHPRRRKQHKVWRPPYSTAHPDIYHHPLGRDDDFMVLASDGLFDFLTSQEVVQVVGEWLQAQSPEAPVGLRNRFAGLNASGALIQAALERASVRRFGPLQQPELNLSQVIGLPENKRRSIHDDTTVVVVFFDTERAPELEPAAATLMAESGGRRQVHWDGKPGGMLTRMQSKLKAIYQEREAGGGVDDVVELRLGSPASNQPIPQVEEDGGPLVQKLQFWRPSTDGSSSSTSAAAALASPERLPLGQLEAVDRLSVNWFGLRQLPVPPSLLAEIQTLRRVAGLPLGPELDEGFRQLVDESEYELPTADYGQSW